MKIFCTVIWIEVFGVTISNVSLAEDGVDILWVTLKVTVEKVFFIHIWGSNSCAMEHSGRYVTALFMALMYF